MTQRHPRHSVATLLDVELSSSRAITADVYLPAASGLPLAGRFPGVVTLTLEGKWSSANRRAATRLAALGRVAIVADVRWTDVIEDNTGLPDVWESASRWARGQEWSDGRIYGHAAGFDAGELLLPALIHGVPLNGAWIHQPSRLDSARCGKSGPIATSPIAWLAHHAIKPTPELVRQQAVEELGDIRETRIESWLSEPQPDLDDPPIPRDRAALTWWQSVVSGDGAPLEVEQIQQAPDWLLVTSGYFHPDVSLAVRLACAARRSGTRVTSLIIGPWTRGRSAERCGEVAFGSSAGADLAQVADDFIDGRPVAESRIFVMGGGLDEACGDFVPHGGVWLTCQQEPVTRPLALYLRSKNRLDRAAPDTSEKSSAFVDDQVHPRRTIGGSIYQLGFLRTLPGHIAPAAARYLEQVEFVATSGPFDQDRPLAWKGIPERQVSSPGRQDSLSFRTPPLEDEVTMVGEATLHLWVCAASNKACVAAKLIDEYPTHHAARGPALLIADVMCCLDDFAVVAATADGDVVAVELRLPYVANRFERAHHIRVDVSGSNFPKYVPLGRPRAAIATVALLQQPEYPSHLVLPTLEEDSA